MVSLLFPEKILICFRVLSPYTSSSNLQVLRADLCKIFILISEFYNIPMHENLTKIHQTDRINSNLNVIQFS